MADEQTTRAPAGLGAAGRALWRAVTKRLELRPDEAVVLEQACREADLLARLESSLSTAPLETPGSTGQTRANPLLAELRAHRLCLDRLLRTLGLEDADFFSGRERVAAGTSVRARKAALARWQRVG